MSTHADGPDPQELVQFRKLKLPGSDSYDGIAEKTAPDQSRFPTASSIRSYGSRTSDGGGAFWLADGRWNVTKLLDMSDAMRVALAKGRKLTCEELEELNFVLDMMLVDKLDHEASAPSVQKNITFPMIQDARLDRLLVEMLGAYDREMTTVPVGGVSFETGLGQEINAAADLQKSWQSRFKSEYFGIEKYRLDSLMSGSLQDVVWSTTASDGLGVWMPTHVVDISEVEGNTRFAPGQWWLNIGCAHRDGIVGAAFEMATKGRYGVAALALLTGREEDMSQDESVYIREGPANDMHHNLISQVGQKIRILRGFRLKSLCTPKAGVRYDGMYRISSWSLKLNMASEMYTLRLTLQRLPNQIPMEDILSIPKPSQLDEWNLYEQLERTRIRKTEGQAKFDDWTVGRKVERTERSQWRRSREFRISLREKEPAAAAAAVGALHSAIYFGTPRRRKLSDIDTDLLPPPEVPEEEMEQ
ncbi:hypothetical protein N0V82_002878 [Gnomoniopsis sp. IMI 355080]|nr:hypothetical protein N0V82_002878 [Gnomoniopsis sp. IMI 355080]